MTDGLILRAWVVAVGAGVGTYLLRFSFLAAARRLAEVPPALGRILRMIPPAVLSAIIAPALLRPDGPIDLVQPRLVAGVVALLVAWRTRNMLLTLLVGMVVLLAVEPVIG